MDSIHSYQWTSERLQHGAQLENEQLDTEEYRFNTTATPGSD